MNSLYLNLYHNNIREKGVEILSLALCQIKSLNSLKLHLDQNYFDLKGAESLSLVFKHLSNLNFLQLSIPPFIAKTVARSLLNIQGIKKFKI